MVLVDVFVLGTSSQFPTKERNHTGFFLRYKTFKALFDCGEGVQRQMRIAGLSPHHVNAIFITHWHGDHTLGIGGIIQSLSASKREVSLNIYGPEGTRERISHIMSTYYFKKTFRINVYEFSPKKEEKVIDNADFSVTCFPLNHGIPCMGFNFYVKPLRKINIDYTKKFGLVKHPLLGKLQKGETITFEGHTITPEKGTYLTDARKVCFLMDTKYFDNLIKYSARSDVLISEATFGKCDEELCKDFGHLSNEEAAYIAKKGESKELVLTHISQRYDNVDKLEKEVKKLFKNSHYAKDFEHIEIN